MVVRGEHVGKVEAVILAHCQPLILFEMQDGAVHLVDPARLGAECGGRRGRIRLPSSTFYCTLWLLEAPSARNWIFWAMVVPSLLLAKQRSVPWSL